MTTIRIKNGTSDIISFVLQTNDGRSASYTAHPSDKLSNDLQFDTTVLNVNSLINIADVGKRVKVVLTQEQIKHTCFKEKKKIKRELLAGVKQFRIQSNTIKVTFKKIVDDIDNIATNIK